LEPGREERSLKKSLISTPFEEKSNSVSIDGLLGIKKPDWYPAQLEKDDSDEPDD
jgi:hypothetical protein